MNCETICSGSVKKNSRNTKRKYEAADDEKKAPKVSRFMKSDSNNTRIMKYYSIDTPFDMKETDDFLTAFMAEGFEASMITSIRFEQINRHKFLNGNFVFIPSHHTEVRVRVAEDFNIDAFAKHFVPGFDPEKDLTVITFSRE